MSYIGAIDQGTTSTRFIIFNKQGKIVGSAQKEHQQIYPKPGWVEHDPLEIIENTRLVVAEALIKANLKIPDIEAVGITNQRETTVVWNRHTGKPYYNAIVWQDTRTEDLVSHFSNSLGQNSWREKTGLPFATYFSGLKLRWLLDNVQGLRVAAESGDALFGTIETWLIWTLTGNHVTDVTNASRTMLMHLQTLDWDQPILEALDIPRHMLPAIVSNNGLLGRVTEGATKGMAICSAIGDQQAALFGQTCFAAGQAKNTYGTGCFMLLHTGEDIVQSRHGLLTTVACRTDNGPATYALEGSVAYTGAVIQWLRDNLGIIKRSADVEALAASVPDNGGVYLVPAFSGLYAPYWRPDARGVVAGLTGYATKAHIARAALEATAWQTLDVLKAMEQDSGQPLEQLNVDGGMVVNNLLMQFQADVLQVPVQRPEVNETTALGAAYLAGLAVGYWKNTDELLANHAISQSWQPAMDAGDVAAAYAK